MEEISYNIGQLSDDLSLLVGKYETKMFIAGLITFALELALGVQEDENYDIYQRIREIEKKQGMN